jgi:hypothetical protein
MPENNGLSVGSGVGVFLTIAWLAFVIGYPMTWRPRLELFTVPPGNQALSLKLPDDGPLRLMIDRNSQLRLAMAPAAADEKANSWLGVAEATRPLPATHIAVDATVLAKTCFSDNRQSDCWVVLSLGEQDAPIVLSAGRVWVLVTRP